MLCSRVLNLSFIARLLRSWRTEPSAVLLRLPGTLPTINGDGTPTSPWPITGPIRTMPTAA
jgi:hypothetical protein